LTILDVKNLCFQEKIKQQGKTAANDQTDRVRRLKAVYIVNTEKYWAKVDETELNKKVDVDNLDEKAHKILQHRIRSIGSIK